MTAPSPDNLPGLVEAVAEAIINADPPDGVTPRRAEAWLPEARAAVAAMVEHLGLVEQFGTDEHCDDHEWADEFVDEASARRAAEADPYLTVVRRLVTPWREVQP